MYKLWCLIIYGYVPKWIIIESKPLGSHQGNYNIGYYYVLRCEQTGKIKAKKFFT